MASWIPEGSRIANATRTWQANEDTPVTDWDTGDPFIIALAQGCDSHGGDTDTFKVQWRASGGSWADLGAAGAMKQSSATDLTDGNDVTAGEAGCTSALAFEQEAGEIEGDHTTPSITLSQDGWCEVQCAVDPADAVAETTYEFQIRIVGDGKDMGAGSATLTIAASIQALTAAVVPVTSSVQSSTISGSGIAPLTAASISVTSSVQQAGITVWLGTWTKRVKLTIDSGDIDTALTNFPILVYISASSGINSEDISFVFDELTNDANRKKIAVTLGEDTECYVEIEKWDHASEKAWLWVKVPTVASGANTDLYLYYDSGHAENTDHVDDTNVGNSHNVWDANFILVHHLHDNPDNEHTVDSTNNNNDGTKIGANTPPEAEGQISKGQDFDGIDDFIDCGTDATLNITDAVTVEGWTKVDTTGSYQMVFRKGGKWYLCTYTDVGNMYNYARINTASGWFRSQSAAQLATGVYYHLAMAYDKTWVTSVIKLYRQGAEEGSYIQQDDCGQIAIATDSVHAFIGNEAAGSYDLDGIIDEVRVSNIARTEPWIKASYESEIDHLLDWGDEEIGAGGGEQELTAAIVAAASSVQVATIAGSGDAPLTQAVVAEASSVVNAAITHTTLNAFITPVAVTSSVQGATIAGLGTAGLTGTLVTVTSSVVNAGVGFVLQASSVAVSSSVQTAAIVGSGNAPLTAAVIGVTSSISQASIGFILQSSSVAVTSSVAVAAIAGSGDAPLTASTVATTSSVANAAVSFVLQAASIAVTSSVQASTLAGSGTAPLTGTSVSVTSSVANAGFGFAVQTITAQVVAVTSSVSSAVISGSGNAPLTGSIVSADSSVSPSVYEYYNTGDDNFGSAYGAIWRYQTFTPSTTHKINSVRLKLNRTGLPGTITVSIRATTGNEPSDGDLCSGTTDGDTLPTGSPYKWREITLGNGYTLVAGTKYAIVFRALSGNASNQPEWRIDTSASTYAGDSGWSINSGTGWTEVTNRDYMFEERGAGSTVAGIGTAPLTGTVVAGASAVSQASIAGLGTTPLTGTVVGVTSSVPASAVSGSGSVILTAAVIATTSNVFNAGLAGSGTAPLTGTTIAITSSVSGSTIALISVIAVILYLYARSETVSLYERSQTTPLYDRASTASLHSRDKAVSLYDREFTTATKGAF